jgi:uncharacterized protein with HEPN domain
MPRDNRVYLRHILDAISKVETYLDGIDRKTFSEQSLIQDGAIRQLEIIGEAVRRLSRDLRDRHPKTAWQDVAGMRDKLIHDYFGVDLDTVWLTAREDLPILKAQMIEILAEPDLAAGS